jgi:hypothetical protein
MPVFNQLPSFRTAQDDPNWLIPEHPIDINVALKMKRDE